MKLKFSVNSIRSAPQNSLAMAIYHNSRKIHDLDPCPMGRLDFGFEALPEQNVIEFRISKKSGKYTKTHNGKNIKDTAVIVENIFCNGFDLFGKVNLFSNYYTEKNGVIRTNGYMGYNGIYKFKFRHPISRHLVLCEYY